MWTACRWALVISAWAVTVSSGKVFTTEKLRAAQAQAVERWQAHPTTDAVKIERLHHTSRLLERGSGVNNITFQNANASGTFDLHKYEPKLILTQSFP